MNQATSSKPLERVHKALARMGVASRRKVEDMIADGLVSKAGKVLSPGDQVASGDRVQVDGKTVMITEKPQRGRVFALNKPQGSVTTASDERSRTVVMEYLPEDVRDSMKYVGRLDINTTGLLLFTDDGELLNALTHPSSQVEREYLVRVRSSLSEDDIDRLTQGIELDGTRVRCEEIVEMNPSKKGTNHWYTLCLVSGVNRAVRRLMEATGHEVSRLKRVRFGPYFLPKNLPEGKCTELSSSEVDDLYTEAQKYTPVQNSTSTPRPFEPRKSYRKGKKLGGKGRQAVSVQRKSSKKAAAAYKNARSEPFGD